MRIGRIATLEAVVRRAQANPNERASERAFEEASSWMTANVRAHRCEAGLTQQEVAEAVGVATTYIARIEAADGSVNVTLRLIASLARALNCRPHELLVPTAAPKPRPPGRPTSTGKRRPAPRAR